MGTMRKNRNVDLTGKSAIIAITLGAAATLTLAVAGPAAAYAPVGAKVTGFGGTGFDDAAGTGLTRCQNQFSGHVTSWKGSGQGGKISIDDMSFSFCDPAAGISVTANNEPWVLTLDSRAQLTITGVDLTFATRTGTGHYAGTLSGGRSFDGVYTISGALSRRGTGSGGPARLGVSILAESIVAGGKPLAP
jgi:hypothetical protein